MAKIVEPPKPRRCVCTDCEAVIEFLPEEVVYDSEMPPYLKCPRPGCTGRGALGRDGRAAATRG